MSTTVICLLLFAGYSVFHILEAWLEQVVIDLKNPSLTNYHELNRKEHLRSAIYATYVALLIWTVPLSLWHCWPLLPAIVLNRRIFFDYALILFRQRPNPALYEGDDWWVHRFKAIFGPKGRNKELAVTLVITIASIIWFLI